MSELVQIIAIIVWIALAYMVFAIIVAVRGLILRRYKLYATSREEFLEQKQRVEDRLRKDGARE
jgi:hypothetical protein